MPRTSFYIDCTPGSMGHLAEMASSQDRKPQAQITWEGRSVWFPAIWRREPYLFPSGFPRFLIHVAAPRLERFAKASLSTRRGCPVGRHLSNARSATSPAWRTGALPRTAGPMRRREAGRVFERGASTPSTELSTTTKTVSCCWSMTRYVSRNQDYRDPATYPKRCCVLWVMTTQVSQN